MVRTTAPTGRDGLGRGALLGPLVTLVTLFVSIQLRWGSVTGVFVAGALLVPAVSLINAGVSSHRRYWLGAALGAVLGSLLALGFIVSAISGVTYLLSDPAGKP